MKNLLLLIFLLIEMIAHAQVAINTDGSLPDNSAMLDVKSTAKGMLVPRMTAAQRDAIVSPATGLLIFCTDNNQYFSNKGTPVSPNWIVVSSQWSSNGSSIFYGGGNVGIGTLTPSTILDIGGGNNWDLQNGEGDFRIGNSLYRIKMGIALAGGGAGAAGIMQYGQTGGYNVLKLGAQGNYLLYLNGSSQKVGIGTDNPVATLDIVGSLRVADGTQASGKVLTSDANGVASWSTGGHYIGESYGGGIVFYVIDNGKHGLIAATADLSSAMQWYNGFFSITNAARDGVFAGLYNTERIIANQATGNYASQVCANYQGGGYGDWYLPSKYELNLLYLQQSVVGGFAGFYWSSDEFDDFDAWIQSFGGGGQTYISKQNPYGVRAIRAF
jgi:hypothetical protein